MVQVLDPVLDHTNSKVNKKLMFIFRRGQRPGDELADTYGDVFLHGDMKKGYEPGQVVKFDGIVNLGRGQAY